jgi:hypothetical protein
MKNNTKSSLYKGYFRGLNSLRLFSYVFPACRQAGFVTFVVIPNAFGTALAGFSLLE